MATKRKHSPDSESSDDFDISESGYKSDEEGGVRIDNIYIPPPPRPPGTIDASGPRLIISKIVNVDFKSYGEEQHLGPFHKNFNAIVGANGSGKSNVIDCMLFVFGYRASKIRSKKLSVMIHKSEKYPNIQSCSVSIHFTLINDKEDNSEDYEEVADSKFVVTRTVFKDNSNYFLLNGKKTQYKEIASVLRKFGVDLDHNRFLILQGEVEQISLMKPKAPNEHEIGMLEYLEDIIGTSRFKEPLSQIDERIELLAQLREEKLKRVLLAEKEKNALREPMQEAVQFLEVENEVTKKRNFLYQRQIKLLNDKAFDYEARKEVLSEKESEMKESLQKLTEEKKSKETLYTDRNRKYEGLIKRKEELQEAFHKANNRDINLLAEFQEINKRRKKFIESVIEENARLEDTKKVPERNLKKIEEIEGREVQLSTESEKLQAQKETLLATVRDETLGLQEKKEKIQTELIDLKHVVDEKKQAFSLSESELKLFMSNEENERHKLENFKNTYENNKTTLAERSKLLKEVKQKLPVVEKQYKEAFANLDRVKIEEVRLINEIKIQRVQVEETRSSMQASKSRGRVLDSLTQQKNEGNLPGLFGRLGDLGAINQKYDVAVSTACGALDNIVVDTVNTAQWCIDFLKQRNIGRATFIALDKQEHLRHLANSKINTPENVPRLYDLIKVEDDRIRPAFYFALRDTLVAVDIDQGTRIAYGEKRYRVVTLKGDLIETSGTMSGGGRSVLKGRMGQQVAVQSKVMSPQKVQDMERSLTTLEHRAKELHEQQTVLESEVNKLQPELRSLKTDLETFTLEVQSLQKQHPNLEKQIRTQEQKVKESCVNPAQLKKIQGDVNNKKAEYEKANNNSEVLQNQVDDISKQIKEKIDTKMRPVNTKLKETTTMLEKIKAELVKLRVAIKTAERNAKKSKDKINNMEHERAEAENKLHEIQKERKELETDAEKLMQIIEKLNKEIDEGKDEFSEQHNEIANLNKKLNKLKSDKIELDQKLTEISKIVKESGDTVARLQKKLSDLQVHEIPEQVVEQLRKYSDEELIETDTKHMEIELKREEDEIKKARPNLTAINEFKKKESNYIERVNELQDATNKRKQMKDLREDIRKKRQKEFHAGFNLISTKLKEMYQLITLGGDAELEMVDSYDPFAEGIVLNVRPPKKSWKNITNLSGGEKTLSSLALVFALHYYKPSPLYFMDEIDAALDFKNVSIVGNYIKERTKNAQFIIISLRSNMFELADHLVGIYKTHNITKSLTINPRHYAAKEVPNENRVFSQVPPSNPNTVMTNSDPASLFDSDSNQATGLSGTTDRENSTPNTENTTGNSENATANTENDLEICIANGVSNTVNMNHEPIADDGMDVDV